MTPLVLHFAQPEGQGVIELLEHYLERAKAGEFSQMFVAFTDREGASGSSSSPCNSVSLLVGAIERGKWNLISVSSS